MESSLYCRVQARRLPSRLDNERLGGIMNWDQMAGKWKQVKGSAKTRWGKLTNDDLDMISGQRDQLVGRIQERYGIAKDEAHHQVDEWHRTLISDPQTRKKKVPGAKRDSLCGRAAIYGPRYSLSF